MKQFFVLLICISIYHLSNAQSVGIGTNTPNASAQLDISSADKGVLVPRMTTAKRNTIASPANGLIVYDTTTGTFWYYNGSGWNEIGASYWTFNSNNIYSSNTGNVGIGTSSPTEKLHVQNGNIFIRDNRTDQNPYVIYDIPAVNFKEGGLQWKRNGDTLASLVYVANPNYANYVRISMQNKGSSPDLVVNTNGHTGLGTVNPQTKLHIYERNGVEVFRIEAQAPLIQIRRRTSADNVITPTFKDIGFIQTSGDNLRIGTNSDNDLGKFVVRTNGADRMFIDQSGNVSIGTEDVASGYKVNVLGKIICEELKVQVKAAWPDYVFNDTHQLMPLPQLKDFINSNKHLPNIPAATQVQQQGMEMGEMQRRMMEKIEELTLYILDLQQQINTLKNGPVYEKVF